MRGKNIFISKEYQSLFRISQELESYKNSKLKKGRTILIQIVDKESKSWTQHNETFRDIKKAIKFLEDEGKK